MNTILRKVCALLDSEDVELQCSAARVLAELKPVDHCVRLSLARHCGIPNLVARNYVLSALERMPGLEALPYLIPLLREGGAVREKAAAIIAAVGPSAISELKKAFSRGDAELRKAMVAILGTIGGREACGFLLQCIGADGPDLTRSVCLALREAIGRMTAEEKKGMLKKIHAFLASPRTKASADMTASGLVILGYLADPSTAKGLIAYASREHPPTVRERALVTLSRLDIPARNYVEIAQAVLPMLDERDRPEIVRGALDVLKRIEMPKGLIPRLEEKMGSADPSVRSFAISQMGRVESHENVEKLLSHLNSGDFQERRAAQEALAAIPAACPRIIMELDGVRDYESGMRLVSILRAHRERVGEAEKRHLFDQMEKLRAGDDQRYSIYGAALQVVAPGFLVERVASRVRRLKSEKAFGEIEELLKILARHSLLSDELKYELAVARLRTNLPDLASVRRRDDIGLGTMGELLAGGSFPLLKRLRAEKALGPVELYHVGFHFSEKLFAQREFGVELLKHILKKWPRSKMAKPARQKLALVGATV